MPSTLSRIVHLYPTLASPVKNEPANPDIFNLFISSTADLKSSGTQKVSNRLRIRHYPDSYFKFTEEPECKIKMYTKTLTIYKPSVG